jgi:hypothetical protein
MCVMNHELEMCGRYDHKAVKFKPYWRQPGQQTRSASPEAPARKAFRRVRAEIDLAKAGSSTLEGFNARSRCGSPLVNWRYLITSFALGILPRNYLNRATFTTEVPLPTIPGSSVRE